MNELWRDYEKNSILIFIPKLGLLARKHQILLKLGVIGELPRSAYLVAQTKKQLGSCCMKLHFWLDISFHRSFSTRLFDNHFLAVHHINALGQILAIHTDAGESIDRTVVHCLWDGNFLDARCRCAVKEIAGDCLSSQGGGRNG